MIIGNGLIANSFKDVDIDNIIIFASGVSDSKSEDINEFDREKVLLLSTISNNSDKKLIYFSTCDFYDSKKSSEYLKHKFQMETLVREKCKSWIIFRVSQIIGSGNKKNLLFNFTLNIIKNNRFDLYTNFDRNLIDIEDVKNIVIFYLHIENEVVNIANVENIKVSRIVEIIEKIINKKSDTNKIYLKNFFKIPLREDFPKIFQNGYYQNCIERFIRNNF
jgi:dTDP-4-dehydrorhamnose reductase